MDKERCALSRPTVQSANARLVKMEIRFPVAHAQSINAQSNDHAKHLKCAFKDVASTSARVWFVAWVQFATFQRANAFARKTL